MRITSRKTTIAFFITLGVCLAATAAVLSTSWVILNWREIVPLILGVIFFVFIIAGVILNTIFLVHEIRRNEQQDSFLNAVTHELKTPITSIRLYLETLQKRNVDEEQRREFYQVMLNDTQRLMGTVEQVLRAARVVQKNALLSRSEIEIGPLVQDTLDLARSRHHLSPEAMDWAGDGRPAERLTVMGDREELATALSNVFDNAVKYSQKDPSIRVDVLTPDLRYVQIRVQDAWHRGISRRIEAYLQALLSRANARCDTGKGQRVGSIYRSRHRAPPWWQCLRGERRSRTGHNRYHSIAEELAVSGILLVEDEEHLARGLKFNLEAEGYPTRVVGDGETALDLLLTKHSEFDLLVLDVMLPGKDGFAVATELRKADHYIPLLMLTARGRPEDVLKGFASGADDYLPKPFDLAILLARIRSLLRRRDWSRTLLKNPPADVRVAEPKDADSLREFDVYTFAGRQVDFGTLELRANGKVFRLTLMEAELLRHLIRNSGKIVSRKSILEEVWGLHEDTDTRAIDNFVVRLRKYIEKDPSHPQHLLTVRGVGYRFLPTLADS